MIKVMKFIHLLALSSWYHAISPGHCVFLKGIVKLKRINTQLLARMNVEQGKDVRQ